MKVSLFATCIVDMFQTDVGKATVELLERLGCEIVFPSGQVCCGQPAFNSGYVKDAKEPMKKMIDTFLDAEVIVTPSGSCAYMFKEYPKVFKDDPSYYDKAEKVASKTYELTDFIVNVLKVENVGAKLEGKATYHPSCHMTRLLGISESPKKLLNNVAGLEMVELPNSFNCCGFGGTFSVKMGNISEQMVDEKVNSTLETGATYLIGADGGCLMNIGGRMQRRGENVRVMHIAEVLNHH